ncbi:MAG TPA: hypothetical protein VFG42_24510 [Baekduia sp.]|uniref:hypothetical protein n=1 Tax=Baekduia sp. TaxID=2600305 RepID=UPI002D7918BD|nr:hypothetical protein [Baekduia sp.]HET6509979.1 hypothetical protein [Baekduia sp.]
MQIILSGTGDAPELADADNFKDFRVVAQGAPDAAALAAATTEIGRSDGAEHVFVTVPALSRMAGARAEDATWRADLEGMLDVAQKHGWVDAQGAVRAHVEWRP